MRRFFNFLLGVALFCIAIGSVQLWREGRIRPFGSQWLRDVSAGRLLPRTPHPEKYTLAEGPRIDLKEVNVLAALSRQRIALARAVVPSVVSITTTPLAQPQDGQTDSFFRNFRRFHGGNNTGRVTRELGSGAIISREGHIVTNNHVIEGASEIEVKLSDDRTLRATLIGTDADTDIAVLKIDAAGLVPLALGDSEAVEVGETVMAVGNPFGLEESVTQGIVSAKNRQGGKNTSDLFQTDSAINPGNSGGPLINVRGELIGVNEAIISESDSWQGVGFAIPSNVVRRTMDSILKTGRVLHGYLGIKSAPLRGSGALVESVFPGSPAERAAIRPGDVIRRFNQRDVKDFEDLLRGVAGVDVDATVPVELLRDGKTVAVSAKITEKPADFGGQAPKPRAPRLPPGHPPIGPQGGEDEEAPGR